MAALLGAAPAYPAQLGLKPRKGAGPQRWLPSANHLEPKRPVQCGEVARLEPSRLALAEPKPHHRTASLEVVFERDCVSLYPGCRRQLGERRTGLFVDQLNGVDPESRAEERRPAGDRLQLTAH